MVLAGLMKHESYESMIDLSLVVNKFERATERGGERKREREREKGRKRGREI